MANQALLDLAWADAIAAARDQIVGAADAAVGALVVDLGQVARVQPTVSHLCGRSFLVTPVPEEHDRVSLDPHHDLAVDEPELVPGIRTAHPAGLHGPGGAVADQQVGLGLPVELVQAHPEPLVAPCRSLLSDRFSSAREGAQRDRHRFRRPAAAAHQPERRRRHEDVADPCPRDQVEGLLGVEPACPIGDDGHPVGKGRHDDVVQASDPGPVRRRPDAIARLWEEVVRQLEPRQVAGKDTVAVECALGRACRSRGVDEQRRRVGSRRRSGERGRSLRQQPLQVVVDVDHDSVEAELGHLLQ